MASDGAAVPDPHVIVLFGALGDLSRRKLLPGLFHLEKAGLMPADYRIVGTSRRGGSADAFRDTARKAIATDGTGGGAGGGVSGGPGVCPLRAPEPGPP